MDGWIKLHRVLLDKPIWLNSTPEQKTLLITLLLMASFQNNQWEWKGEKYTVVPGQFVTSLSSISIHCGKGIKTQSIRTALKRFEKLEFLTNESTKTGRLITICNWKDYQLNENGTNIDANKDLTKTQQRPNKDLTPIKKDKKDNNDKKKDKRKNKYVYEKRKHGEYVFLHDIEYDRLCDDYNRKIVDEYITKLDLYIGSKGLQNKYKDHNMTVRAWLNKDGVYKIERKKQKYKEWKKVKCKSCGIETKLEKEIIEKNECIACGKEIQ